MLRMFIYIQWRPCNLTIKEIKDKFWNKIWKIRSIFMFIFVFLQFDLCRLRLLLWFTILSQVLHLYPPSTGSESFSGGGFLHFFLCLLPRLLYFKILLHPIYYHICSWMGHSKVAYFHYSCCSCCFSSSRITSCTK